MRARTRRRGCGGFTLVEALWVGALIGMIMAATFATQFSLGRALQAFGNEADVQTHSRQTLERMSRLVRSANAVTVENGGAQVRITTDPNRTSGDASDDITFLYYVEAGNLFVQNLGRTGDVPRPRRLLAANVAGAAAAGVAQYFERNGQTLIIAIPLDEESHDRRRARTALVSQIYLRSL